MSRRSERRYWLDRPVEWSDDDLRFMSRLTWIPEEDAWAREHLAAERRTRRRLRRELVTRMLWVVGGLGVVVLCGLFLLRGV